MSNARDIERAIDQPNEVITRENHMFKRILKSMLAVMLTAGLTTSAAAEIKPFGLVTTHFGQLSNDEKVTAYESDGSAASENKAKGASFEYLFKGKFGIDFEQGDLSARTWVSSRSGQTSAQKVYTKAAYKASDSLKFIMGNALTPDGSMGLTLGGGYMNYETGYLLDLDVLHAANAYIEHPGAIVKYNINPYAAVSFGLYTMNTLFNNWIGYPEYVGIVTAQATAGRACANCTKASPTSGSGMSLSFQGMLSRQLLVGAAYLTSTRDDYNGLPTDSSNAMNLTGMYFMGDMTFAADYSTTKRAMFTGIEDSTGAAVDGELTATDIGVLFKMKGIGPGEIGVKLASLTLETTTASLGDLDALSYDETNTHLHYEIPLAGKSAKAGILYESIAKTPKASGSDTITQTWIGATLAARF